MKLWNLEALIKDLKFKLTFNEGQTDLEFSGPSEDPDRYFRDYINEAYADELRDAKQIGDSRWFYHIQSLVWPSGQLTYELPSSMDMKGLISVYDITNSDPGSPLWFNVWEAGASHLWRTRATMQWGTSGPGSDRTIRFTYLGDSQELVHDTDEPVLIPNDCRHLLSWRAASKLRLIADDSYPAGWDREMREIREGMLKFFSQRGPLQTGATGVLNTQPDFSIYT